MYSFIIAYMTKGTQDNLKKQITKLSRQEALQKKPKKCGNCTSENIEYWGETDEVIIFQCQHCKGFHPIQFDTSKLKFYFFT